MISQQRSRGREACIITCLGATARRAVLVGAAQVLTCRHEAVSLLGHTGVVSLSCPDTGEQLNSQVLSEWNAKVQ